MKSIRFTLEGVLNSFRIPFFRNYHKTFLAPPKTTIIGFLMNISNKTQKEFFEILDNETIEISVVIENIKGKTKDLWSYKTFDKKNRGKSIVRRDKLYNATYLIYLKILDKDLYNEILQNLKNPKNIPALGLDDEIVTIKYLKEIELIDNPTNRIDSIFLDKGYNYKAFIKDREKFVELPTSFITPTKFEAFNKGKRVAKNVKEEFKQIEFINCEIEIDAKSYLDEENGKRILFY